MLLCLLALLGAVRGNDLCAQPDKSLSKNRVYNPAFKYSVELGGTCQRSDFIFGPVIGKGHYGVVRKAQHTPTGRTVALKFLNGLNPAKHMLHRNEECNSHAAESPLLVKHYCTMIHDDDVIFVMDYLDGMSLREYFKGGGKLTDQQLQYYTSQMMMALEILHQKGIIFGSLTSANVMLLKDGRLKLIDFGATMRLMPGEKPELKPTFVSYKARPHRWKNFAHDYYSLGILVFELAYANKTGKWSDPKELRKIKCSKVLDQAICDFITRMYTEDYQNIWGTTKRTRDLLKKHPWFSDIDWDWIKDYAMGNVSMNEEKADESEDQEVLYYVEVDEDDYYS